MGKSTLKIDRYCPLVMQGFSNFFKGCFKWLWQTLIVNVKIPIKDGMTIPNTRSLDLATCDKISDVIARRSTLQTAWLQEKLRRIHWKRRLFYRIKVDCLDDFFLEKNTFCFSKKIPTFFYKTRKSNCGRKWSCRHAISSVLVFPRSFCLKPWLDGQAAYLLISALPSCLDPDAFAIPPPSWWSPTVAAEAVEGGHGVPLGLVARHPEVAWEVDGQLQLLIGAAKRTGDPKDVWWNLVKGMDQNGPIPTPQKKQQPSPWKELFGFKFQRLLVVDLRVWSSKWNLWQLWTFHCEVFKSLCVFST